MNPSAFPLAWPPGRPRKPAAARRRGTFSSGGKRLNNATATERLDAEVQRLGGRYALLSSNLELTLSGRPRSDRGEPADPGVCVYFQLAGKPFAMACDAYDRVADNIAALAAHIEATRAIERHGVATAAETLQAFAALPPPPAWRQVFGFPEDVAVDVSRVTAAYRRLAAFRHPCLSALHPQIPVLVFWSWGDALPDERTKEMANIKYFSGERELRSIVYNGGRTSDPASFEGYPEGVEPVFIDGIGWTGRVPADRAVNYKANPSRHDCDARCFNATGRVMNCECSCGGKNHGRGAFKCEAA